MTAVASSAFLPEHLVYDPILGSGPVSDVLILALPVLWTVAVAPMVSYRRRDAVAWLVPVVGLLLAVRLAWRLAHLPFRDWPPRADERNRCRPTDVQGDAGQPLYVRTPATGRTPAAD